jgi:pimeloyl-ACP methyl ester carboxylesterase
MPKILRTPNSRFANLSGFPFAPNYVERLPSCGDVRIHYLDEGNRSADVTFLCLHGEPAWSYLYRKMVPIFVQRGHRVVAPDLIGFGKSDKFAEKKDYSFEGHRKMLLEFVERLDLQNIVLVCQDWGGVLGLTLPMEMPDRFSRLLVMNTALTTGDFKIGLPFKLWKAYSRIFPDMNIGRILKLAEPRLTEAEVAAYNAPFPDKSYKAGAMIFPSLVPTRFDDPGAEIARKAREWLSREWKGESFMAIGEKDPILGPRAMLPLSKIIRNCPEPFMVKAGHFVQERGEIVAQRALERFRL